MNAHVVAHDAVHPPPWTDRPARACATTDGLRALEVSACGRAQLMGDSAQCGDAALYVGAADGVALAHGSHQLGR
jgi:hypothetical protein